MLEAGTGIARASINALFYFRSIESRAPGTAARFSIKAREHNETFFCATQELGQILHESRVCDPKNPLQPT